MEGNWWVGESSAPWEAVGEAVAWEGGDRLQSRQEVELKVLKDVPATSQGLLAKELVAPEDCGRGEEGGQL